MLKRGKFEVVTIPSSSEQAHKRRITTMSKNFSKISLELRPLRNVSRMKFPQDHGNWARNGYSVSWEKRRQHVCRDAAILEQLPQV